MDAQTDGIAMVYTRYIAYILSRIKKIEVVFPVV